MAVVALAVGMAGETAGKIGSAVVVAGSGMTLEGIGRTERAGGTGRATGEIVEETVEEIS